MNNLLNTYKEILGDTDKWRYYSKMTASENIFTNEENAKQFIEKYFSKGGKQILFDGEFSLERVRIFHIISTFFLGIHLSECILKEEKYKLQPNFEYLWYLTSLYHDYGYTIEGNAEKNNPTKLDTIKRVMTFNDIQQKPYSKKNIGENWKKFSIKTIEQYYKYCARERVKVDHGIIGGLLLYDRLMKNYQDAYDKEKGEPPTEKNVKRYKFHHNDLLFSSRQFSYFAKVAIAIITHNIWFCTPKKDKKICELYHIYNKYKLNQLIINKDDLNNKKHNWHDDRFLFLLILTDVIEPVKYFKDIKPECVMEKISISSNYDTINISVLDNCINPKPWFERIKSLEKWVKLKVEYASNNLKIFDFTNG